MADLIATGVGVSTVTLGWTATGDDGTTGTATSYDLRYSTAILTEGNWAAASQAVGKPPPSPPGSPEGFTVTGLASGTFYYFALKVTDDAGNVSALSNVPSATTDPPPDTTAPDAVTDLTIVDRTATSLTVRWTVPGDDGGRCLPSGGRADPARGRRPPEARSHRIERRHALLRRPQDDG